MWPVEFPVVDHPKDAPGGCPSCAPGTPVSVLATWMGNGLSFAAPSRFSIICVDDLMTTMIIAIICNYYQKYQNQDLHAHTHIYIYSTYLLPSNISIFHFDCYYRTCHRALCIAMRYSLLSRTRYQSFGTDPISELSISHIKFIFFVAEVLVFLTGYCQVHFFMCVSNPA